MFSHQHPLSQMKQIDNLQEKETTINTSFLMKYAPNDVKIISVQGNNF